MIIHLQKLASVQTGSILVKFARSPCTDPQGKRGDEDIFKKVKAGKYSFDPSDWKHVSKQAQKFVSVSHGTFDGEGGGYVCIFRKPVLGCWRIRFLQIHMIFPVFD